MMIVPIPVKEASRKWKRLRCYIKQASGNEESISLVHKRTNEGDLLLAEVVHKNEVIGAVLFEVLDDSFHIMSLAADGLPNNWHREFFNQWSSLAKVFKKDKLTLKGRKGWTRALAPLGFKLDNDGFLGVMI